VTVGILVGVGITLYFVGVVLVGFMGLVGGAGPLAIPIAVFWPILIPYWYVSARIGNARHRREQEKKR
jgi:hypothetical protein